MPAIDPVILELMVDAKGYHAELNRTLGMTERGMTRIEAQGQRIGSGLRAAFVGAGAAAGAFLATVSAGALIASAREALNYAASLGEVSQSLGVSTKLLQEFRFAATQNGASVADADGALGKFSVTLGKAFTGSKDAAGAFEKIGVSLDALKGASDSERFALVADAIASIKDPAEQSSAAIAIFGRGATAIIPTLKAGADAFRAQAAEARAYGLVLSDSQIQSADKTADKIDALTSALRAKVAGAVADNADAIGMLANSLADLAVKAVRALSAWNAWSARKDSGSMNELFQTSGGRRAMFDMVNQRIAARNASAKARGLTRQQIAGERDSSDGRTYEDLVSLRRNIVRAEVAGRRIEAVQSRTKQVRAVTSDGTREDAPATRGGGGPPRAPSGPTRDPTANLRQFEAEYSRGQGEVASAMAELAGSIDARREAEIEAIDRQRVANLAEIKAREGLTRKQREALATVEDDLADKRTALVNSRADADLRQQALDVLRTNLSTDLDLLELQAGNARTAAEARTIQLSIIDLRYRQEDADLRNAIASEKEASAREALVRRLESLPARRAEAEQGARDSTAGPRERYYKDSFDPGKLDEALQNVEVNGLRALNEGLTDAIMNSKSLGDVFENVAKQIIADLIRIAVQQLIVNSLMSALGVPGGGGGGGGGLLSSLFGRASGGYVAPGQMVRVNEQGGRRVEGFRPVGGGTVVPLGQMNAPARMSGGEGGTVTVQLMLSDDIDGRIMAVSGPVAVEVLRANAPQIVVAAKSETMRSLGRPGL